MGVEKYGGRMVMKKGGRTLRKKWGWGEEKLKGRRKGGGWGEEGRKNGKEEVVDGG